MDAFLFFCVVMVCCDQFAKTFTVKERTWTENASNATPRRRNDGPSPLCASRIHGQA